MGAELKFEKVLVLSPHTDDGELGAGGTIVKLAEGGAQIFYVAFSIADESLPKGFEPGTLKRESKAATAILGIPEHNLIFFDYKVRRLNYSRQEVLEDLVRLRREIDPDLVILPALTDIHQDHGTVAMEGHRAFRGKCVLGYELIWNIREANGQCFVSLNEAQVARKIEALGVYASQRSREYMQADSVRSWARSKGLQCGVKYAESFEISRLVV